MSLPKISETETTENNITVLKANTYEENTQTLIFKFVKKPKEEELPLILEKHKSQKSLNIFEKSRKLNL